MKTTKKKYSQTREELMLKLIHREQPRAYDYAKNNCVYDQNINGGCAIGCDIKPSLAKKLIGFAFCVIDKLPKRLQKMGKDFLEDIQIIHDLRKHWIN